MSMFDARCLQTGRALRLSLAWLAAVPLLAACTTTEPQLPGLGIPVTTNQLSGFDLVVDAQGNGLPAGSGTAAAGESVYRSRCLSCHGEGGEGLSSATVLTGGSMQSDGPPLKTVGSYWPYASTLFDFIRRAMPANAPKSLSDQEVYDVTAYVLFINGIVERNTTLDQNNLASIRMPNADGFIDYSDVR